MRFPLSALAVAGVLAVATPAAAQLTSMGPIGPYGDPTYYEDPDGFALAHCVERDDARCLLDVLPNPDAELNVATGNFHGESFYFAADATMPTAAGEALLVLAVEGVWDDANRS